MQTRCRLTETGSCFVSVFTASVRAQCLGNGVETCGAKDISCEAPWDSSPRERTLWEHLFIGLQYATTRLSVVNDWWCHPPLNIQLFSSGGYRRLTQSSVVHHITLQNICWMFHFSFLLPLVSFLFSQLTLTVSFDRLPTLWPFWFLWPCITRTALSQAQVSSEDDNSNDPAENGQRGWSFILSSCCCWGLRCPGKRLKLWDSKWLSVLKQKELKDDVFHVESDLHLELTFINNYCLGCKRVFLNTALEIFNQMLNSDQTHSGVKLHKNKAK